MINKTIKSVIIFIFIYTVSGTQNDTGTVIFQYQNGLATGCFKDIIDASEYSDDTTFSSIYYPYSPDERIHNLFGVGCNEDTGYSYPIDGYFHAEGFNKLLNAIDSAGFMIDTSGLVVKIIGKHFTPYDWTFEELDEFYDYCALIDSTNNCRIIIGLYDSIEICTTTTEKIIEKDSATSPVRLVINLTDLFKYAIVNNALDLNKKLSISIILPHNCESSSYYVEYGIAIDADEESNDKQKYPQLYLHATLVENSSIKNYSFLGKSIDFVIFSNPFTLSKTIHFSTACQLHEFR